MAQNTTMATLTEDEQASVVAHMKASVIHPLEADLQRLFAGVSTPNELRAKNGLLPLQVKNAEMIQGRRDAKNWSPEQQTFHAEIDGGYVLDEISDSDAIDEAAEWARVWAEEMREHKNLYMGFRETGVAGWVMPEHLHVKPEMVMSLIAMANEKDVDTGRNPEKANPVREKIDQAIEVLNGRTVAEPDRGRLRKALDKADAPAPGRQGSDEALGKALGRRNSLGLVSWVR